MLIRAVTSSSPRCHFGWCLPLVRPTPAAPAPISPNSTPPPAHHGAASTGLQRALSARLGHLQRNTSRLTSSARLQIAEIDSPSLNIPLPLLDSLTSRSSLTPSGHSQQSPFPCQAVSPGVLLLNSSPLCLLAYACLSNRSRCGSEATYALLDCTAALSLLG